MIVDEFSYFIIYIFSNSPKAKDCVANLFARGGLFGVNEKLGECDEEGADQVGGEHGVEGPG